MIEAIVILFIVGFAALHVAFELSPKLVQQKLRGAMAAGLNKIGLHAMAMRFVAIPDAADKACGSGCDACGTEGARDELKTDSGAKVMHFHQRLR
jgi:NO-binding membrane sensor protein with MHYT domain